MTCAEVLRTTESVAGEIYSKLKATAVKRGRRPDRPFVPVIDRGICTEQVRGRAYATRAEAVAMAQKQIEKDRAEFVRKANDLKYGRALRDCYGIAPPSKSENGE